jgi:glycosyltransferase involved in cell wall biosynthesis
MAELLTQNFNYNIDIFTSNAIDFKALRDPQGKVIMKNNKFHNEVNSLKINRFSIQYDISEEEILQKLKKIPLFNSLNLSDNLIKKFISNGPYLVNLIDYFLEQRKLNYDLIHTTFFPYFNLIISLIVGRKINKPIICTPFFHFSNPRYLDSALIEILKKFDVIIACTNLEKEVLVKKFKIKDEKIKVISMGVDYKIFEGVHRTKLNHYYFKQNFFNKREKNYRLVLYCGYKNYEKGALTILKSIPYILEKTKKVYFVFIGPPTKAFNRELSKIQKLRNSRIINFTPDNLTGYYDKKKLTAFKEADLFVMPSRSDAFGIAFLEAWAAGKPVIGARSGATPEVIRENIDGLLVNFDDHEETAQKVIKLLKSKKLRKRLGSAGQLKVFQNYTWEKVAEKTHQTYQNLIKRNV